MPALVAGIHVFLFGRQARKTWMAGTSPAMTASLIQCRWKTLQDFDGERGTDRRIDGGVRLRSVARDAALDQRVPGAAGGGRRPLGARRSAQRVQRLVL